MKGEPSLWSSVKGIFLLLLNYLIDNENGRGVDWQLNLLF